MKWIVQTRVYKLHSWLMLMLQQRQILMNHMPHVKNSAFPPHVAFSKLYSVASYGVCY
jgi:hypothetical protein